MKLLLDSFWRAAAYCLHPRVIVLSLLPLVLMSVLALVAGYFFWASAVEAVRVQIASWSVLGSVFGWMANVGLPDLQSALAPLLVVAVLTPLIVVLSLLLVAMLMTPSMLGLVAQRRFPLLERKHGGSFVGAVFGATWATLAALAGLLITVPLWFVPPLVLVLPPLIWGWLTYRVMTYDVLADHASAAEREALMRTHRPSLLAMGVISGYLGAAPAWCGRPESCSSRWRRCWCRWRSGSTRWCSRFPAFGSRTTRWRRWSRCVRRRGGWGAVAVGLWHFGRDGHTPRICPAGVAADPRAGLRRRTPATAMTESLTVGLLIIGDEILSGKRADKHLPKMIELLAARGLALTWARYIGDDPDRITADLRDAFSAAAAGALVFSCGGIGATPDDHTRQCAARALGRPLALHPQARDLIVERMREIAAEQGQTFDPDRADNQHRLNMGVFPEGAEIIPNPYNRIAGFAHRFAPSADDGSAGGVFFVPGFPVMAWPMIEWVLDIHYGGQHRTRGAAEKSVIVFGAMEASLTPLMEDLEHRFTGIKVFSLPSVDHPEWGRHIELGVKGNESLLEAAYVALLDGLRRFGAKLGPELVR